jgi:hypothetical protein
MDRDRAKTPTWAHRARRARLGQAHAELLLQRRLRAAQVGSLGGTDRVRRDPVRPGPASTRRRTLHEELREIDAALRRIEAGSYGTCERCGEPIPAVHLNAAPQSRYCAGCR